jgi:hypothetical protein
MPDPTPTHSKTPWEADVDLVMIAGGTMDDIVADCGHDKHKVGVANAALIVAAVNERPGLVAEVERLRALLRGVVKGWGYTAGHRGDGIPDEYCGLWRDVIDAANDKEPSHGR